MPNLRDAWDYNRSLAWPVRAAHVAVAAVVTPIVELWAWATAPRRRAWAVPLLLGSIAALLATPLDGAVRGVLLRADGSMRVGGDVRRELEAWQQFGGITSLVVVALLVWRIDPRRRARLLDLALAAVAVGVACFLLKTLVGRARPVLGDPSRVLGPFDVEPLTTRDGSTTLAHAWSLWSDAPVEQLWSMPSSHTAAAAMLAVFIAGMYPRVAPIAWGLVAVVGAGRLITGAHWVSDVIVGATLGLVVGRVVVDRSLGVRLVLGRSAAGTAS